MPIAEERKASTVIPAACESRLSADSHPKACQVVLVEKEIAALKASAGESPGSPRGLPGRTP